MTVEQSTDASPASPPLTWKTIDWPRVRQEVRRLQMRIAKATQAGQHRKVQALQRVLTHSRSAKLLAVHKVTTNRGAKTPGVDNIIWRTDKQKLNAALNLKRHGYRPRPLRRHYIPKPNGKLRPLSIPTLHDRAMQALHALALAPVAETLADRYSYGFREGRRCADALEQCFALLSKGYSPHWVLEGDIRACFDQISHPWLLTHVPMDKLMLRAWLKAGYWEKDQLFPTDAGTPQGGLISPLLSNLALDGMEQAVKAVSGRGDKVNFVRYADDFIVTGATRELLEQKVKPALTAFLAQRGLELSEQKTVITSIDSGFDFLGHTLRKYRGKLLVTPAKSKVKILRHKISELRQKFCYPGRSWKNGQTIRCAKSPVTLAGMDKDMSQSTRKQVLEKLRRRYQTAGAQHKTKLLDEAVQLLGYHRKAAIRALHKQPAAGDVKWPVAVTGRPVKYEPNLLLPWLRPIWQASDYACGRRLVAMLPEWIPAYEQHEKSLPGEVREKLLLASGRTLDRLLEPLRGQGAGRSLTRPGTLLRQQIPIRGSFWEEGKAGWMEVDTVALCGGSVAGEFVWMVDGVDYATTWVELRAMWGRGQAGTLAALQDIEAALPFLLLGLDSDNGGEFLNHHVLKWLQKRRQPVFMTRSRPFKKDDNAHVEQKNWTHVRQCFGYERYDNPELVAPMNLLVKGAYGQLLNYFHASLKLDHKERKNGKERRIYGPAQTPLTRVLASAEVSEATKKRLLQNKARLNPFALKLVVTRSLKVIAAMRRRSRGN